MSLRMAILGLVSYKEMSGYDINKLFAGSLKFFFTAPQSQVYRELNTLKKDGFIIERREEQSSRPSKNMFSITEDGKTVLYDWLMECGEEQHFAQRLPYIFKIFFAAKIPDEALLSSLERFRALSIAKRERLQAAYDHKADLLIPYDVTDDDFFYWELTIDYGLSIFTMYLEWVDRSIASLKKRMAQKALAAGES